MGDRSTGRATPARHRVAAIAVTVVVALLGACTATRDTERAAGRPEVPAITAAAPFRAAGSVHGAYVLGAPAGAELILADADGTQVATAVADERGSVVFYDLTPGDGYTVRHRDGDEVLGTDPFTVLDPEVPPDPSLYDQTLVPGLNYVRMRDGVELAVTVRLPPGATLEDGPFPTVIEYSGYQIAAPGDLLADVAARVADPDRPVDPLVPATSTAVGSLIAPVLGFAAVSVQMRGSGCSGGAFDLFDLPTIYDGYDVVETVAAQDWVKGNKVGMVGISFSGLSQLFTAGTRPPSLAAIAPLSVADDLYRDVGWPGGIYNDGFAQSWLEERANDARPAPEGGQPWARALVEAGDQRCIANQALHGQARDVFAILDENPTRVPELYDRREPQRWAAEIDVPVFLSTAFQDEQIIGGGPQLLAALADNPDVWVTLMNGTHVDPLGPGTITRWAEFLWLFVADEIPRIPDAVLQLGDELYRQIAGAGSAAIEPPRFAGMTDVEAARAEYRRDPRVRVLMDVGGGDQGPGALQPTWSLELDGWPPSGVTPTSFYLGAGGTLTTSPPTDDAADRYRSDPAARPARSLPSGGQAWAAQPGYDWAPVADGAGLGYVSAPLERDLVVAGPSTMVLQLSSSAPDTDLQVTLSEVRPDGGESYVQFGVLRASYRELDPRSSELETIPTFSAEGRAELPAGTVTEVRVPLYPVAYAFRAGSRIRVTIQAPGGDRPAWTFDTIEDGTTTNTISSSPAAPSRLVLPVLTGRSAAIPLPACGALRGSPCRPYVPAANGG